MNRAQKKARFNFVDAVILLIVLAIIGSAIYLIVSDLKISRNSRQTNTVDFTVRISSVQESALPLFTEGTIVKDSVTGKIIGNIISVETKKAKYFGTVATPNESGVYTVPVSEYSDKYDVYVKILTTAEMDTRGIQYVGDTKILIGSEVYFKIPSFTSISYITDYTLMPMA